jgi:hypothetical protein
VLKQLAPLILEHQGKREMFGFLEGPVETAAEVRLGGYAWNVFTLRPPLVRAVNF